jgi:seryl-tRNA synthetase
MLNGTAGALSRLLLAIVENYQQADGSILIPDALQKFMVGNKKVI